MRLLNLPYGDVFSPKARRLLGADIITVKFNYLESEQQFSFQGKRSWPAGMANFAVI